jgi:hypothetical protein
MSSFHYAIKHHLQVESFFKLKHGDLQTLRARVSRPKFSGPLIRRSARWPTSHPERASRRPSRQGGAARPSQYCIYTNRLPVLCGCCIRRRALSPKLTALVPKVRDRVLTGVYGGAHLLVLSMRVSTSHGLDPQPQEAWGFLRWCRGYESPSGEARQDFSCGRRALFATSLGTCGAAPVHRRGCNNADRPVESLRVVPAVESSPPFSELVGPASGLARLGRVILGPFRSRSMVAVELSGQESVDPSAVGLIPPRSSAVCSPFDLASYNADFFNGEAST